MRCIRVYLSSASLYERLANSGWCICLILDEALPLWLPLAFSAESATALLIAFSRATRRGGDEGDEEGEGEKEKEEKGKVEVEDEKMKKDDEDEKTNSKEGGEEGE